MKILLDNNILNLETFEEFDKNNILKLKENGIISFYVSDMTFHENLISLSQIDKKSFNQLLDYLFKYADNNFFLKISKIIQKEIKNSDLENNYFLYSKEYLAMFKNDFKNNNVIWDYEKNRNNIAHNKKMYELFKSDTKRLENEFHACKTIKDKENLLNKIIQEDKNLKLLPNLEKELEKIENNIEGRIKYLIKQKSSMNLITDFAENYTTLPSDLVKLYHKDVYFTKFIDIYTYTFSYRFDNAKKPFDKSFNDNEYICCMKDLDVLLTNDRKYLKHCFEHVYRSTNKKILTLDSLFKELKSIKLL